MNYRPAPRTKTQDLIKRLNQASIGRVTDEVALRRIEACVVSTEPGGRPSAKIDRSSGWARQSDWTGR